ncbi:glycosyltransferase [Sulfurovum sp. CS9]|uniref:glycosyltransferase n=1 Tax=Sulfurovum sp. CS9 TaxID=3391146 RepID=UPI0039EA9F12
MKIIINTSNLNGGGGVQVALSFINELKYMDKDHEYYIFLSKEVNAQIDQKEFPDNFEFYLIDKSPASLKTRKEIVAKLNSLEEQIEPDVVFSVFGPSYWKPKSKHIMGFAVPWVLQKDSVAYDELELFARVKMHLWVEYVSYYAKRDASDYIIETNDGKERLSKVLGIAKNKISVVGNSYSSTFDDPKYLSRKNPNFIELPTKEADEFRLLLITHNNPHKNLKIINKVLPLLEGYKIKFVLTIDDNSFTSLFRNNDKQVLNLGPVKQKSCPSLYGQCDALFLPTLLEVFSASYPEAMKMGKPILTSNYSFATDVCQDAALYFDPLDPKDIAKKIKKLIEDKELQKELIEKGKKRVKEFETARSRAEKYIALCEKIVKLQIGEE